MDKNGWKQDPISGRWYKDVKPGYREYATDYIIKGKPEEKKEEDHKALLKDCPVRKGIAKACKTECVAYIDGCGLLSRRGQAGTGKFCPISGNICVINNCSWYAGTNCKLFMEE